MRDRVIAVGIVLILFAVGVYTGLLGIDRSMPSSLNKPTEIALVRSIVRRALSTLGPRAAYNQLKQKIHERPSGQKHAIISLFGEELFYAFGVNGLAYCDDSYGFGCYHGLFQRAITQKGMSIIHDLDAACIAAFGVLGLGCPHGIGHGIGEFMGPEQLIRSLELCGSLSYKGDWSGCQGGVFMEYNFPSRFREDVSEGYARAADPNRLHEPCDRVPASSKKACYFELASWWQDVFRQDYSRIGHLCAEITEADSTEYCFLGVGFHSVFLDGPIKTDITTVCSRMPDDVGVMLCLAGASFAYSTVESLKHDAQSLCEGLGSKMYTLCIQKSKIL